MRAHMLSLYSNAAPSGGTACAHAWHYEHIDRPAVEFPVAARFKHLRERLAVKQVLRFLHP